MEIWQAMFKHNNNPRTFIAYDDKTKRCVEQRGRMTFTPNGGFGFLE